MQRLPAKLRGKAAFGAPPRRRYSMAERMGQINRNRALVMAVPRQLPYASTSATVGRVSVRPNEVKSFDCVPITMNLTAVAAVLGTEPAAWATGLTCVNEVQQGATYFNRIGSKIVMKSIRLTMNLVTSANTVVTTCRTMLIYDRQPNAAFPLIADILSDSAGTQTFSSGINMQNKSRFMVIRDQYNQMDAAQSLIHTVNLFCKGRWETEFKANNGTVGDIATGALLLLVFKGQQVGAGNVTAYDTTVRIRYFD